MVSMSDTAAAPQRTHARSLREPISSGQNVNVGTLERVGSGLAGALLAATGIALLARRGSILGGLGVAAAGAALAWRGTTGYCAGYQAMGIRKDDATTTSHPLNRSMHVVRRTIINRSPDELYDHWHNFENLPQIMRHLKRVETRGDGRSHWVAAAPRGGTVEWDAQVTEDRRGELIAWKSEEGASVPNHGHVRFQALPHGHGTAVEVSLDYRPPAGVIGEAVAMAFGESPQQQLREDLRRFKQTMEAGELATTVGQPRGRCGG